MNGKNPARSALQYGQTFLLGSRLPGYFSAGNAKFLPVAERNGC